MTKLRVVQDDESRLETEPGLDEDDVDTVEIGIPNTDIEEVPAVRLRHQLSYLKPVPIGTTGYAVAEVHWDNDDAMELAHVLLHFDGKPLPDLTMYNMRLHAFVGSVPYSVSVAARLVSLTESLRLDMCMAHSASVGMAEAAADTREDGGVVLTGLTFQSVRSTFNRR